MAYMTTGRGVGAYEGPGDVWNWEFYPPPYDWLAPANSTPMPAPILPKGRGMAGCGCGCGGDCGGHGAGLGLFEAGLDWSQWGIAEWTLVGLGSYLVLSIVGDMFSAGRKVTGAVRKRRARKDRYKRAKAELAAAKKDVPLLGF